MGEFSLDDTIVAIATPPGRGGLGVVRLSGPAAVSIARALTGRAAFQPRHATLAHILEARGDEPHREPDESPEGPPSDRPDRGPAASTAPVANGRGHVDEVVVTWFAAPHSYTGEDVIEISGHGSPPVQEHIVVLAMRAGGRLAEPGEFTFRAYLNGRLDLVQAEAVADLVDAVTPLQARAAMDQLEGTLTTAIRGIDAALFDLTARLEASLDFPEEGFHFVTRAEARADLRQIGDRLDALALDGRAGRVVREGRLVVIVGPPNAGKSSLFNALVGASRAIVTPIPGTTRDAVTERVDIGGLPVTLVDTAGLRETNDPVEAEGVVRTRQAQQIAALTVIVLDQSEALGPDACALVRNRADAAIVVINKSDRPPVWTPRDLGHGAGEVVTVSAATGDGLTGLRSRIARELSGRDDWRDPPAITNTRHLALVDDARAMLGRADSAIGDGASEEVVLMDLGEARRALEAITGRRGPDEILRHIFSRFCVGK
jgi:tRNA modification GTPase